VFKDLANILYKLFTILAALVVLNYTKAGNKLSKQHYTAYFISAVIVYFLLWILQTLLKQPIRAERFIPISLLLILGSVASCLALLLISSNIAIITLVLWLTVFMVFVTYNYRLQRENNKGITNGDDVSDALITEAEDVGDDNGSTLELEMEKIFKKLDTKGDGKVLISDLRAIMGKLGIGDNVDDGGSITLQEFIELCTTKSETEEDIENIKDVFDVFDIDGDGFITVEELNTLMKSFGEECSLAKCGKLISCIDTDGDGRIDFNEFRIMMMGPQHHTNIVELET